MFTHRKKKIVPLFTSLVFFFLCPVQASENETTTDDRITNNETTDDRTTNNETTDDRTTNNETTDDRITNNETTDDRTTNNKTTDEENNSLIESVIVFTENHPATLLATLGLTLVMGLWIGFLTCKPREIIEKKIQYVEVEPEPKIESVEKKVGNGGNVIVHAAAGAAAGSVLGPVGSVGGAVIGCITGLISS